MFHNVCHSFKMLLGNHPQRAGGSILKYVPHMIKNTRFETLAEKQDYYLKTYVKFCDMGRDRSYKTEEQNSPRFFGTKGYIRKQCQQL
jgi:hypothetical protein